MYDNDTKTVMTKNISEAPQEIIALPAQKVSMSEQLATDAISHCTPCCAALILIQVVSPGCLNHRSKKGKVQSAFTELWHLAMGLPQLDFL